MNHQSSDKKQLILDQAIELFSKNGIADTGIANITDALGIGKGTFYLYFNGKKDLLLHCIERLAKIIVPKEVWLDIRAETNYKLRFHKRFVAFLEAYPTFSAILNLVGQSLESKDPDLAKKAGDAYRLLAGPMIKDLRWAVRHGWVKEIDEEIIAFMLLGAAEGLGNMLKIDSRYSIERIVEIAWDLVMNGIGSSETVGLEETGSLCWDLYDSDRNRMRLRDLRANAKSYLAGMMGKITIQVPLPSIESIALEGSGDVLSAAVATTSGKSVTLTVNGDISLTGETEFGRCEIPLRQVTGISRVIATNEESAGDGADHE